jgi:hypothetical protein
LDVLGAATTNTPQIVVGRGTATGTWAGQPSQQTNWGIGSDASLITTALYASRQQVSIEFKPSSLTLSVSGSTITFAGTSANDESFYLFGTNGTTEYRAYARIYSAKFTQNSTIVRNFIPAVRKSDNEPGLYDTVNNTFYTNVGTGEFTVGNTVTRYLIPVTSGTTTTTITLAEPLRRIIAGSTTYTDYSDYKAQKVYRQCRVKALTGTESWIVWNGNYFSTAIDRQSPVDALVCSHFINSSAEGISYQPASSSGLKIAAAAVPFATSVDELKAWLAAQYAAGTPVTIVYPLATATEESVSLPALPTERGATTTVDVATEVVPSNVEIVYRGK